ncbi:MAG TPA: hypothetical protein VJ936_09235, partial [Desulfobacteraceae bacterium]|nr:hypothetical protein [Desulfobacteraceae bacterium]
KKCDIGDGKKFKPEMKKNTFWWPIFHGAGSFFLTDLLIAEINSGQDWTISHNHSRVNHINQHFFTMTAHTNIHGVGCPA